MMDEDRGGHQAASARRYDGIQHQSSTLTLLVKWYTWALATMGDAPVLSADMLALPTMHE